MGALTGEYTTTWAGYLAAHHKQQVFFKTFSATAGDHGNATAQTEDLPQEVAARLFDKALRGVYTADEVDMFWGHMLIEMARLVDYAYLATLGGQGAACR